MFDNLEKSLCRLFNMLLFNMLVENRDTVFCAVDLDAYSTLYRTTYEAMAKDLGITKSDFYAIGLVKRCRNLGDLAQVADRFKIEDTKRSLFTKMLYPV